MTLITTTKGGRPLYRVRINFRMVTDPVTGRRRKVFEEKDFRKKADARAFLKRATPITTTDTEKITIGEIATLYRSRYLESVDHQGNRHVEQRTAKDGVEQIEIRIRPFWDRHRAARVRPQDTTEWKSWMLDQTRTVRRRKRDQWGAVMREPDVGKRPGKIIVEDVTLSTSAATANKSIRFMAAMMRWARSEGLTETRVFDDVRELPAPKPQPANSYTPEQVDRIARGCELLRDEALVLLAAYSGLRWSELCALRWSDIDMDAELVDLQRALDLDRSTKAPKSHRARIVPVLAPGMVGLRRWREVAPAGQELVFPDEKGGPLRSNWYARNLVRIRQACEISFEPHELRDTYASILIQTTGIGEAELTMWLGHRSVQTTRDRYGKLFEKRKARLASKANAALAAGAF